MLSKLIEWSVNNRFMVLMLTFIITGLGVYSVKEIHTHTGDDKGQHQHHKTVVDRPFNEF